MREINLQVALSALEMNDFNNNKTFSNWKVTEWMRLTRRGEANFQRITGQFDPLFLLLESSPTSKVS